MSEDEPAIHRRPMRPRARANKKPSPRRTGHQGRGRTSRATPTPQHGRGGPGRANPGRWAAACASVEVEQGAHLEDVLPPLLPDAPIDRGLAWFLAMAVQRTLLSTDAAIQAHLRQPVYELEPAVRATLRVGAVELLHGRAKRYAVVSQAVEVARALGAGRASGLVNAVLRRVEPVEDLAPWLALDHPAWLVARWEERFGEAATRAWCLANQKPAPLAIVGRGDGVRLAQLMEGAGIEAAATSLFDEVLPGVFRLSWEGRVDHLPGFEEGAFWVQDPASVLMADLIDVSPGDQVLDACAAPGGKSFRLASRGARVLAVDRSPRRLKTLSDAAARLRLSIGTQTHDWLDGPIDGLPAADAVLIDAPCTGLGTLRRRPEIRWRRQPGDLEQSAERQAVILKHASTHVKEGGQLAYVVCSAEPEEGPDVVHAFIERNPTFTLRRERSTAPPSNDEDAFYGALLVKTA